MIFFSMIMMASLAGSAFLFTHFYFRYSHPSKNQIETDRRALQVMVDARPLQPWASDESGLLCQLAPGTKKYRGWKDRKMGTLFTIYEEPVVAWASYHYKSQVPQYLLVVRISGIPVLLTFHIRESGIHLFGDERHIASLDETGTWTLVPAGSGTWSYILLEDGSAELVHGSRRMALLAGPEASGRLKPKAFLWLEESGPEDGFWMRCLGVFWTIALMENLPMPRPTK